MKWGRRVTVGLVVFVGCFVAWCVIAFFRPYVRDFSSATYDGFVAKAGADFELPSRAKDIRVVYSSVSLGGRAHVVKFTAPLEDCRRYALADFRHYEIQQNNTLTPEFMPINGRPNRPPSMKQYGIGDLGWFDVENVEEGITLKRDHDHRPFTWIDTRRGTLYTLWTD
jgi:hypothetical protein